MIWRFFPGPAWVRIIAMLAVLAILVWAVISFVYPWVTTMLPQPPSTIEGMTSLGGQPAQ